MLTVCVLFFHALSTPRIGSNGLDRDGSIPGYEAPEEWPELLEREWSVEVETGHAPLVVSDEQVLLHSRLDD